MLERKDRAGTITPHEKQGLSDINHTDNACDQAIKAVCTDGKKGDSAWVALVGPAQKTLKNYGENASYALIYKDFYPQDAANLEYVLQGKPLDVAKMASQIVGFSGKTDARICEKNR